MHKQQQQHERSNSRGKRRIDFGFGKKTSPSPSKYNQQSSSGKKRRISNYEPPESISHKADSDFGEEIEDQYYKRSVPSGGGLLLLSPKRSSEPPNAGTLLSPANRDLHGDRRGLAQLEVDDEDGDEGVDLDQFAHLSVDEDESDEGAAEGLQRQLLAAADGHQSRIDGNNFLGAVGMIELEEDESDDENEFNEADFKRF